MANAYFMIDAIQSSALGTLSSLYSEELRTCSDLQLPQPYMSDANDAQSARTLVRFYTIQRNNCRADSHNRINKRLHCDFERYSNAV